MELLQLVLRHAVGLCVRVDCAGHHRPWGLNVVGRHQFVDQLIPHLAVGLPLGGGLEIGPDCRRQRRQVLEVAHLAG